MSMALQAPMARYPIEWVALDALPPLPSDLRGLTRRTALGRLHASWQRQVMLLENALGRPALVRAHTALWLQVRSASGLPWRAEDVVAARGDRITI